MKELAIAKSRLVVPAGSDRAQVALAMACDVIAAALGCEAVGCVVAVTNDPLGASAAKDLGAHVVPDIPDAGHNPALEHAADLVHAAGWECIAALSSDLPALSSAELDAVLEAVASTRSGVVADAEGSGTVLFAARQTVLHPRFGAGSFARHLDQGAQDLTPEVPAPRGLRQDVDTADDLAAALRIGVGPHTSAALSNHRPTAAIGG